MAVNKKTDRREFIKLTGKALGIAGLGCCALMTEIGEADAFGNDTVDIDLQGIELGFGEVVVWKGKPVFVRRRTPEEVKAVRKVSAKTLRDPAKDEDRVQKSEWIVVIGLCTHYACVPVGTKAGQLKGDFGGWFCACHGSHYDISGRVRKGVAPRNLEVPKYVFLDENTIRIG